jgi:hypothetical protein
MPCHSAVPIMEILFTTGIEKANQCFPLEIVNPWILKSHDFYFAKTSLKSSKLIFSHHSKDN